MKATQPRNGMQWLLVLFIVVGAIVLLRNALDRPAPEGPVAESSVEAVSEPQEAQPVAAPPDVAQDAEFSARNPLYFRAVFGPEGTDAMLGVLDESAGPGTGYNVAYVDENNNGDLTDESAKTFRRIERGSRSGQMEPRFEFKGPFKGGQDATYTLNIYSLGREDRAKPGPDDYYFFWYLNTDQWRYFFINGKMRLSASVADAQEAPPVRLGGPCQWEISAKARNGEAMVSAGLKDENGCTLRVLSASGKDLSPRMGLIKDGEVVAEPAMEFG